MAEKIRFTNEQFKEITDAIHKSNNNRYKEDVSDNCIVSQEIIDKINRSKHYKKEDLLKQEAKREAAEKEISTSLFFAKVIISIIILLATITSIVLVFISPMNTQQAVVVIVTLFFLGFGLTGSILDTISRNKRG